MPSAWSAVLANVAGGVTRRQRPARCWPAPASDDVHLLVVCTAERGLCGAFNSSIARLARERATRADGARARRSRSSASARRATTVLRRQFAKQIIELIELRAVRQLGFDNADTIAQEDHRAVRGRRVRRRDAVLLALPLGDRADPDGAADHPGRRSRRRPTRARARAAYEYEPEEGEILATLLPRNISVQIFRALLENAASEQGARMSVMDNATRNAGEMIKKQTMHLQPLASGDDHQGTDRNHLGRGSALTGSGVRTNHGHTFQTSAHRPHHAGHRRRRRRAVRGPPAGDPERARDDEQRQPPGARSRPASRRVTRCAASRWTRPKASCAASP